MFGPDRLPFQQSLRPGQDTGMSERKLRGAYRVIVIHEDGVRVEVASGLSKLEAEELQKRMRELTALKTVLVEPEED
jgi:hypothetical protein